MRTLCLLHGEFSSKVDVFSYTISRHEDHTHNELILSHSCSQDKCTVWLLHQPGMALPSTGSRSCWRISRHCSNKLLHGSVEKMFEKWDPTCWLQDSYSWGFPITIQSNILYNTLAILTKGITSNCGLQLRRVRWKCKGSSQVSISSRSADLKHLQKILAMQCLYLSPSPMSKVCTIITPQQGAWVPDWSTQVHFVFWRYTYSYPNTWKQETVGKVRLIFWLFSPCEWVNHSSLMSSLCGLCLANFAPWEMPRA